MISDHSEKAATWPGKYQNKLKYVKYYRFKNVCFRNGLADGLLGLFRMLTPVKPAPEIGQGQDEGIALQASALRRSYFGIT